MERAAIVTGGSSGIVVRMLLRLSPRARIPQAVIERVGSTNGDVPVGGA